MLELGRKRSEPQWEWIRIPLLRSIHCSIVAMPMVSEHFHISSKVPAAHQVLFLVYEFSAPNTEADTPHALLMRTNPHKSTYQAHAHTDTTQKHHYSVLHHEKILHVHLDDSGKNFSFECILSSICLVVKKACQWVKLIFFFLEIPSLVFFLKINSF